MLTRDENAEPERGLVTVLFADLAGFTDFCERAGEEAAYLLMQHLVKILREIIEAQGGSVRSFTGDGIMALFGVPRVLEDGPLRACRAALLIQKELSAQSAWIKSRYGLWPQLRIGISAGLAIIGRVESNEDSSVTALGDTVNVAARLQALAQPGAVMLSEAAQRLVEGMVESRFSGEHRIKGKAEPQRVFRPEAIRQLAARSVGLAKTGRSAKRAKTKSRTLCVDRWRTRWSVLPRAAHRYIERAAIPHHRSD